MRRRRTAVEVGGIGLVAVLSLAGVGLAGAGCEAEVTGTGGSGTPASAVEFKTAVTPGAPIETAAAVTAAPATVGGVEKFGAPLSAGPAVDLDEVLAAPEKFAAGPVKLTGIVQSVCKEKGCWMTLVGSSKKADLLVRVRFKEYGFFVPKDCEGARVTLDGTVAVAEESEAEAKHYAEDEAKASGKPVAEVKGPRKKLAIEATGVELVRARADG